MSHAERDGWRPPYLVVRDTSIGYFWCEPVSRRFWEGHPRWARNWEVMHEHRSFGEADDAADEELTLRAVHDS